MMDDQMDFAVALPMIRECPHCGSDAVYARVHVDDGDMMWGVHCAQCTRTDGWHDDPLAAVRSWNDIARIVDYGG